ncbi:MAG: dihydrofolate reductase family protein [bacterium]|nr:dihydrofolate reductase family protein [bacterium]
MKKAIVFIATSLDGYIAREDGSFEWLFTDQDYGYTPFSTGIDTVVMGRKTFDVTMSFPEYPHAGQQVYVFSRTRTEAPRDDIVIVNRDPGEFLRELKQQEGTGNIWIVGGGELLRDLLTAGEIDEFQIAVHPVLLGGGISLIAPKAKTSWLNLKACQPYETGLVMLKYEVIK